MVVCVHGFNVELHEAFTWFRVLTDTMKNLHGADGGGIGDRVVTSAADLAAKPSAAKNSLTAFIGFSWPSDGKVLSYASDRSEAIRSAAPFGHVLTRLKMTGRSVNLVCHSMGNFVARHTLAALVNEHLVPPNAAGNERMMGLFKRDETGHSDEPEHIEPACPGTPSDATAGPNSEPMRHLSACEIGSRRIWENRILITRPLAG